MDLSELAWRVLLLFLPGLVAFIIVERLTVHRRLELHNILLYSFVLGPVTYGLYALVLRLVSSLVPGLPAVSFFSSLTDSKTSIDFAEVLRVSGVAVFVGFGVALAINRKVLYRIARFLRVSERYGDLNVFGYVMNSPTTAWLVVRDLDRDLMFQGWVQAFSDSDEEFEELLLRDVIVYSNSSGEELLRSGALLVSRPRGALLIELSDIPFANTSASTINPAGKDE